MCDVWVTNYAESYALAESIGFSWCALSIWQAEHSRKSCWLRLTSRRKGNKAMWSVFIINIWNYIDKATPIYLFLLKIILFGQKNTFYLKKTHLSGFLFFSNFTIFCIKLNFTKFCVKQQINLVWSNMPFMHEDNVLIAYTKV